MAKKVKKGWVRVDHDSLGVIAWGKKGRTPSKAEILELVKAGGMMGVWESLVYTGQRLTGIEARLAVIEQLLRNVGRWLKKIEKAQAGRRTR